MSGSVILAICILIGCHAANVRDQETLYSLLIVHFNDFHANYEELNKFSGPCGNEVDCMGGFSRLYETATTLIKGHSNALLLNAGDNYEGTYWYTVLKWNVTQYFLNKLPVDAMTLGNHEFDDGVEGLVPLLENINTNVIVCNINVDEEPSMKNSFQKSVVVTRNGRKIGIIGVTTTDATLTSNTGNVRFLDEVQSVNEEAERLVREENVFTNIVLSHSGYETDQKIAKHASGKIALIVGGHTHSFLFTGDHPPGPDTPVGPYPTVIHSLENRTVLIVQASSATKYLGNITVYYDTNGNIIEWNGSPIFLDASLPKSSYIDAEMLPWKAEVDQQGKTVIGRSISSMGNSKCRREECELGDLITNAMFSKYKDRAARSIFEPVAVIHGGGMRAGLASGNITVYDLMSVLPFGSTVDIAQITGFDLKEAFKSCVDKSDMYYVQVFQVSQSMKIVYDLSMPIGSRLKFMKIRRKDQNSYENVLDEETYNIILPSFLSTSGFFPFSTRIKNREIGQLDSEVVSQYLQQHSPIEQKVEGALKLYSGWSRRSP